MRILLIDAPYDRLQGVKVTSNYPLGLAYLASSLNKKGHNTLYLNLDWDPSLPSYNPFSAEMVINRYGDYLRETTSSSDHAAWTDFKKVLEAFRPELVGLSTPSVKIKSVFRLVELAKSINSAIFTVLGGHHSHIFAREILEHNKNVDFIIAGEGEETFAGLIAALEHKSVLGVDGIPGLVYRGEGGNIIFNKPRPLITNLDALPFPSPCCYYKNGEFFRIPFEGIMASRGCPFSCGYCGSNNIWGRKVRMRSPENVIDEVRCIIRNQKAQLLSFYDDCFTLDAKWLTQFCDILIKDRICINWQCITSSNLLEESIFKKIVSAGCIKINIGIESGSKRILKLADKNIDLDETRRVFEIAKRYRISASAYIMIGFPTETEHDIKLTQKIIKEIRPNWVYCNVLMPLPGTPFYDQCIGNNLINPVTAWRGDSVKSLITNYTGTLSDEGFLRIVNETFDICRKINAKIFNLVKRAPVGAYFRNPTVFFSDLRHAFTYLKRS